eukprot:TRINITY_DN1829_c0_g1_i2.p1 TRINITY_DN1829_c0_g1~~TRINITY_DN1829_c0_g1_i2.p1  ORF type:complete len:319 (+),score=40.06 TRINITY_DN1829_c0_g1_i2:78-1034(+)
MFFPRNVVFILDRSGSMTGDPFEQAVKGLDAALKSLRPIDNFNVCVFDDRMETWQMSLTSAGSPGSIESAMSWVNLHAPKGGLTDIFSPMQWAVKLLNEAVESKVPGLPFIFLLTDGAVKNERDICKWAKTSAGHVRLLTFGIGSYCNWYFLKQLAEIGRGFNANVVYQEQIYWQVSNLLRMASVPVLTNITLDMDGIESVDLYPNPVPDLFCGAPLQLAGKYVAESQFPEKIGLKGVLSDGRAILIDVLTTTNSQIPVNKVFLKQRIDLLTARAWLEESKELEEEIVRLSVSESMPSKYTTMVAYEVAAKDKKKRQR